MAGKIPFNISPSNLFLGNFRQIIEEKWGNIMIWSAQIYKWGG